MKYSITRQVRDIQYQAERLLNGEPSASEIEAFDRYNEELRAFLLTHLKEQDLLERTQHIPKVIQAENTVQMSQSALMSVLSFVTNGLTSYLRERRRIKDAQENIREVRSRYASIEFLMKNVK